LKHGLAAALFAGSLAVYMASGSVVPDSYDTAPNAYVPVSLIADGDLAFTPLEAPLMFLWRVKGAPSTEPVTVQSWDQVADGSNRTYAAYQRQGLLEYLGPRYFLIATQRKGEGGQPLYAGVFGVAAGLTALPAAAVVQRLGGDLRRDPFAVFRAAKWTAALLAAGSVALVFLVAAGFTSRARAFLLAALYAFGTCLWTVSSQALWQQTAALFFLALGAFCLIRGESVWMRGAAAGLAFSAAVACRPTAAAVALAAAAYLAFAERRALAAYVAAALPVAAAMVTYNLHYFGAPLEFGQITGSAAIAQWKTGSPELWQTPVWLGAAGLMVSPSRGLLVFSPFLVLAFAGAVLIWKDPAHARLRFLAVAVPLLWLPSFLWFDWWGGWTYGYRPIMDSLPLLAVLCLPALDRALEHREWKGMFVVAAAWSLFVQVLGVLAYAPEDWNGRRLASGTPANIDLPEYRARLWSVRDSQIGYLVTNFSRLRAR
jgi:hypothetical protein